jgi:hypothetical protein
MRKLKNRQSDNQTVEKNEKCGTRKDCLQDMLIAWNKVKPHLSSIYLSSFKKRQSIKSID